MKKEIDLHLSILCVVAEPGQTLSRDVIADICECSKESIKQIELRALKKLRQSEILKELQDN